MGPCEWPVVGCGDCDALNELETPQDGRVSADQIREFATGFLWAVTGRKFGVCPVSVRPVARCGPSTWNDPVGAWEPALIGGEWHNLTCGACSGQCGCDAPGVVLPGPVSEVTQVTIDGVTVDPSEYRIDSRAVLVREDGAWPTTQDLDLPAGAPGTWQIDYLRGVPVPTGGQVAAGLLACELAKAVCGRRDCQLPQRVQSVTRDGMSLTMLDPFDGFTDGQTGIWAIDAWVSSQVKAPRPLRVFSPDYRPAPMR